MYVTSYHCYVHSRYIYVQHVMFNPNYLPLSSLPLHSVSCNFITQVTQLRYPEHYIHIVLIFHKKI